MSGGADVAALGVENERDVRVMLAQVGAHRFELRLGAQRGKIGDLRLEGAGQVGRGVNDRLAKRKNGVRLVLQVRGDARQVGIEPDAQQRIVAGPRGR